MPARGHIDVLGYDQAKELGWDLTNVKLPEGHILVGNPNGEPYLRISSKADQSIEKLTIDWKNKKFVPWDKLTEPQKRAKVIAQNAKPVSRSIEDALSAVEASAYLTAYTRSMEPILTHLQSVGVDVSQVIKNASSVSTPKAGSALRGEIRDAAMGYIDGQSSRIETMNDMYSEALKTASDSGQSFAGSLFEEFARKFPQEGITNVEPKKTNDLKIKKTNDLKIAKTNRADGIYKIPRFVETDGIVRSGSTYFMEAKGGENAFRITQAEAYSSNIKNGVITSETDAKLDGVVYVFQNKDAAFDARKQINDSSVITKNEGGVIRIHILFYSEEGSKYVEWIR